MLVSNFKLLLAGAKFSKSASRAFRFDKAERKSRFAQPVVMNASAYSLPSRPNMATNINIFR
eukprot:3260371-Amphidinium_carterae.1